MHSQVSAGIKALEKELDVPSIALSQLNRECEKSVNNKHPNPSQLCGSGSLEQDADVIMFIYRDEVYNEHSQHRSIAEIIFGKLRNGEVGTDDLASRLDVCRFDNLMHEVLEVVDEPRRKFKVTG